MAGATEWVGVRARNALGFLTIEKKSAMTILVDTTLFGPMFLKDKVSHGYHALSG